MIIYYTKDFKDVLKDPARYINISKFKLSSCKDIEQDNINSILQQEGIITSPTLGYYTAEGITSVNSNSDTLLSLSIRIPISDISKEDYTTLFVFYDDFSDTSDDFSPRLAFIVSGNMILKDNKVFFEKLNLEPEGTIITITIPKPKCSLKLNQGDDLDFLEGKGVGNIYSLFLDNSSEIRNFGYVSRESYEAYLLEQRGDDDYDHLYTQYINNYGLKIY